MIHKLAVVPIALLMICGLLIPAASSEAATDSGWETPEAIDRPDIGPSIYPTIVTDSEGNAMAVWGQWNIDDSTYDVMANRYVVGHGWSLPQAVETSSIPLLEEPAAAVDGNGNVTVVWSYDISTGFRLYANQYVPGVGWGIPQLVQPDTLCNPVRPSVAVAGDDTVFVVWTQTDSMYNNVTACRYVPGVGWESPEAIEEENLANPSYARVAADDLGNAAATWRVWNVSRYDVWGNYYTSGSGWGKAQPLEDDIINSATESRVALDSSGNATVVWNQLTGAFPSVYANRYEVGSGWGSPILLEEEDLGNAFYPDVWADGDGNAIAVWIQNDGVVNNILSNRYVAGDGWDGAEIIDDWEYSAGYVRIDGDGRGNAIAVWQQSDGVSMSIASNRYVSGEGWGVAEFIETDLGGVQRPHVSVNPSGDAFAVWTQSDGATMRVCANRYTVPDTTPPVLSITEPSSGTTTQLPVVTVSGYTEPGAQLSISGVLAAVDPSTGEFSVDIALMDGENVIEVIATDTSGNEKRITVTVTFEDPSSELLDELEALQDQLDSVTDLLESTKSLLNETVERLEEVEGQTTTDDTSDSMLSLVLGLVGGVIGAAVLLGAYIAMGRRKTGSVNDGDDRGRSPPPP